LEHFPLKLFRVEVYPKCARSLPCLSKTDLERPGLERIGKLNDRRGIGDVGDDKKKREKGPYLSAYLSCAIGNSKKAPKCEPLI